MKPVVLITTKMKNLISSNNGQLIPVVSQMANLAPLFYAGKPVTDGNGKQVMNNRWIYVEMANYGLHSINVLRADYCCKKQLEGISILESIGNKKITARLSAFIEEVSANLLFERKGITYRVYLRQVGRKFDLDCVKCYWLTTGPAINMPIGKLSEKYKSVVTIRGNKPLSWVKWAHELVVCLPTVFGFNL